MNYKHLPAGLLALLLASCGSPITPLAVRFTTPTVVGATSTALPAVQPTNVVVTPMMQPPVTTPSSDPSASRGTPASLTASPAIAQTKPATADHFRAHIVAPGESIVDLVHDAESIRTLLRYNHLGSETLRPGQPLLIGSHNRSDPIEHVLVERGDPTKPRVALTFDAGASAAPTPKLLAALRDHGVHVTFFLTGKWMQDNPDLLRQIVADGHEIANHSFHHSNFTKLDDNAIRDELQTTDQIAQEIANVDTRPYFRPPYGAYNKHVLDVAIDAGYLPIYWTFDSLDSVGAPKPPQFLVDRVTTHLVGDKLNGAIILMHCGSAATAEAVPTILDRFAAHGVQVVKISEVLGP